MTKQTPSISPVATNIANKLLQVCGVPSGMCLGYILGLVHASNGFMPIAERKALQDALNHVRERVEKSARSDTESNDRVIKAIDATLEFIRRLPEGLPEQTLCISDLPDSAAGKTLRLKDRRVAAKVASVIVGSVTKKVPQAQASA